MRNKTIKHWIVLLIASLMAASTIGIMINASGVFYNPIADSLNKRHGDVAMHGMFQLISSATASLYVPRLLKRYPFKMLVSVGTVFACLATFMMGLSNSVIMLNILTTIRGISSSVFSIIPINLIINNWFFKQKGLALSIALSFSGIAGAVFAPIFTKLIESVGWQSSFFVMSGILLICSLPAILIPFNLNPKDENILPYGYIEDDNIKSLDKVIKPNDNFNFMQFTFMLMFILSLINSTLTSMSQHFPGFSISIGESLEIGASMLAAAMYGNIVSKLVIGLISDIKGPVFASLSMLLVNVISIFMILFASNSLMMIIGSFLFGSIYSVSAVGISLLTAHFFELENYPKIFPVISFSGTLGGALALPIFGYVYDFTGSYSIVFFLALLIHFIDIIIIIYLAIKIKKLNLKSSFEL